MFFWVVIGVPVIVLASRLTGRGLRPPAFGPLSPAERVVVLVCGTL